MQTSTIVSITISLALIGGTLYAVSGGEVAQTQNIEIRDGVQYVTVSARGGYFPRVSQIQPGIPTKLVVKTSGTYDCSASLVIRSAGFEKVLQPTGEEVIDLGVLKPDENVQGVCGMGMYNFQLRASQTL
jgi:plastocyanin domain-containing protein